MNKVFMIGRLARDPEVSYTASNKAVAKFTLAIDAGKDHTDFPRVTVFGQTAENVGRYMKKGRQIAVEGHIATGSYEKDGKTIYTTDIIGDRVEFLGRRDDGIEF